jgi:hypothetical protein
MTGRYASSRSMEAAQHPGWRRREKTLNVSMRKRGQMAKRLMSRLRSMMGRRPTGFGTRKGRAKKPGEGGETSTMALSTCSASTSTSKRVT